VWQDLKDDGLITPVSDNEYVLKGCDVRGTPPRAGCVQAPKTNSLGDTAPEAFVFILFFACGLVFLCHLLVLVPAHHVVVERG
jgi:hypothetical protein